MDKTERLFALLDALRRRRSPVTADVLAQEQNVSTRTIYRDVQTLIGLGAPIDGEAGLGYVLRKGFFMPPLMFSPTELEALVLGARWVQTLPDGELGEAAKNALAKIATASPDDLRTRIEDAGLWPVRLSGGSEVMPVLEQARSAMRSEHAVRLIYSDVSGKQSERIVWPLQLAYYENKQILVAWCKLRSDFRLFRTDRILNLEITSEPYGEPRRSLAARWLASWKKQHEQTPQVSREEDD